jgi:2-keto-4-pentenoate hydratase
MMRVRRHGRRSAFRARAHGGPDAAASPGRITGPDGSRYDRRDGTTHTTMTDAATTPARDAARHPASLALIDARRGGKTVPAIAPADTAAAYRVQHEVAATLGWFADGPARAWKSGGASVDGPRTHAPLPPSGVHASPADLRAAPFAIRRIEAELALRLGRDVDADAARTFDGSRPGEFVDALCVAIEVVDSRWTEGLDAAPLAKLADLQSHGALVLGAWVPFAPRDWAAQRCCTTIGARCTDVRTGSHPMGDPTRVLGAWLRHATDDGATLRAGTVVTTGSWCGMLEAAAGDAVEVAFDGIGVARLVF